MTRLFVDCDDTLVLFEGAGAHPFGGYMDIPWKPNEPLIEGIRQFRKDNHDALIVVWSGGGRQYAQMWIDRLLPDVVDVVAMGKDSLAGSLIEPDSIVVDDQNFLPGHGLLYRPNEWPVREN